MSMVREFIFWVSLFFFLFQYKISSFYFQRFGDILSFVDFGKKEIYEQIQAQHPYYEIYKISQRAKDENLQVYKYFTLEKYEYLDETSTLFLQQKDPEAKRKNLKVYRTEPELFLAYYLYPAKAKRLNLKKLFSGKIPKDSVIITDVDLEYNYPFLKDKLERIEIKEKGFVIPNRRENFKFFIFRII